jgi:hypothetical protein
VELKISTLINKLKDTIQGKLKTDLKNKHIYLAFGALGALCLLLSLQKTSVPVMTEEKAPTSVDTFIPAGLVLVPIEISNSESLASLVGEMGGVVDLYLASNDQRKGGLKVAAKVKLVRAPLNPQQYAVLIREEEGPRLMAYAGPFLAVVQNPDAKGTELSQTSKKSIRIDYQN